MHCKACNKYVEEGMNIDDPLCDECNFYSRDAMRDYEYGSAQLVPPSDERGYRWSSQYVMVRYADDDESRDPNET